MSLAIDLTTNQVEIEKAEREASALLRRARNVIPPAIYAELQLKLCLIASEGLKLKTNLGALRMMGELEQRPPEVRVESLELSEWCWGPLKRQDKAFAEQLKRIGDDTLDPEPIFDRHVSVEEQEEETRRG